MSEPDKYKVECFVCGRVLRLSKLSVPLPVHPQKGEPDIEGVPYSPCPGSGQTGMYVNNDA